MDAEFDPRWEALNELSIPEVGESPEVRQEFLERERQRIGEMDQMFDTAGWALLQQELSEKMEELYQQLRRCDDPMTMFRLQGRIQALEVVITAPTRARETMSALDLELDEAMKET